MRSAILILFVCALRCLGDIGVLQHFENSTDATALTTNILAGGLLNSGPGYWTVTNFTDGNNSITNMTVRTAAEQAGFLRPIVIGATTNTDSGSTRGIRTTYGELKRRWAEYEINTNNSTKITVGAYVKLSATGWTGGIFDSFDYVVITADNGDFIVLNWWDNTGPGPCWQVHTQTGKGIDLSSTTNFFNPTRDKYYWVSIFGDFNQGASGIAHIWFYDPVTWIRVGTSTLSLGATTPASRTWRQVQFGQYEPHSSTSTGYMEIDDMVIDTSGTRWPLLPGTSTQLALSPSRTDTSDAITTATTGDNVVLPSGSNAWTSTLSIAKRIQLSGQGTNTNPTILTNAIGTDLDPIISFAQGSYQSTLSNLCIFGTNYSTTDLKGYGIETLTNDMRMSHLFIKDLESASAFNGYGVVHHSIVVNCQRVGRHFGYIPGGSQVRTDRYPVAFNSTNYFFWEDSGVEVNSGYTDTTASSLSVMSGQEGMSYVVRRCNFVLNKMNWAPLFDVHGNDPGIPSLHSSCGSQVYKVNVTFGGTATHNGKGWDLRGGQSLIYSNVLTGFATDTNGVITMREEDLDVPQTAIETVANTYLFENYGGVSGTTALPPTVTAGHGSAIALNSQYFVTAPAGAYNTWSPPYPYGSSDAGSGSSTYYAPSRIKGLRLRR